MKKTIGALITAAVVFCACGNKDTSSLPSVLEMQQNTTLSYVDDAKTLGNVLQTYDTPVQRFQTTSKKPSIVTGNLGTIVHVNPANLETFDGQPLGETIDVELKEYCTQMDLLRGNVATVSDGQLLVSGGAYYLNMSSDGNPLRIKQGKSLEVEFPKFADEEMELFYGQRDSLGQMNWQVAQQQFRARNAAEATRTTETKPVVVTVEEVLTIVDNFVIVESPYEVDTVDMTGFSQEELEALKKQKQKENELRAKITETEVSMYQAIKINQLGWINVDRFLKMSDRTPLLIAFNEPEKIRFANLYLVFKDINSLMQRFYYPADYIKITGESGFASFKDLPVGYNVRLIAYGFSEEGELYVHSSDLTIEKDGKLFIDLQKSSNDDLDKLFASN